jgi:hypothetical protein
VIGHWRVANHTTIYERITMRNHIVQFFHPEPCPSDEEMLRYFNEHPDVPFNFVNNCFWFETAEHATHFIMHFGGKYYDKSKPRVNGKVV